MGGAGGGHKSVRARQSRLVNIQKARAARRRAPLPWRSGMESRIIEQLVWQWWVSTASGGWQVTRGEKRQGRDARRDVAEDRDSLNARNRTGCEMRGTLQWSVPEGSVRGGGQWSVRRGGSGAARPWAKLRVARFLGVSHTWVNKLVKRFEADPDRMRRKMAAFAPASIEKLERAREETRRQRERGWLRGPIRYRRVKVTLYGKKRKVMVPTKQNKQQIPHAAAVRPVRNDNIPLPYREIPDWAKGLLLPGDLGTVQRRTPRPVPFAFRRRK